GKPLGEGFTAFRAPRMNPDLLEIEQLVKQADVPVRGTAGADMTENPAVLSGQVLRPKGRDGAGSHLRDIRGVQKGAHHAGFRVKQVQYRQLRRQPLLVVVVEVRHNFYTSQLHRPDVAAQHVEVTVPGRLRYQVHPRFDHGFPVPLGAQSGLDGVENLLVAQLERLNVVVVEVGEFY